MCSCCGESPGGSGVGLAGKVAPLGAAEVKGAEAEGTAVAEEGTSRSAKQAAYPGAGAEQADLTV